MLYLTQEEALKAPSADGVRHVVMIEPVWEAFVRLIYSHELTLFDIPADGLSPTYAVSPAAPRRPKEKP